MSFWVCRNEAGKTFLPLFRFYFRFFLPQLADVMQTRSFQHMMNVHDVEKSGEGRDEVDGIPEKKIN
jgi:hypothetical protein